MIPRRRITLESLSRLEAANDAETSAIADARAGLRWLKELQKIKISDPTHLLCDGCRMDILPYEELILKEDGDDYPQFELETTQEALLMSAYEGCNLCSLLYACLMDCIISCDDRLQPIPRTELVTIRGSFDHYTRDNVPGLLSIWVESEHRNDNHHISGNNDFEIFTEPNDKAASWILPRELLLDLASDEAFNCAKEWLIDCPIGHQDCSPPVDAILPTRVIKIPSKESTEVIRIFETNGVSGRYAALSYCWGGDQSSKTTSSNYQAYLQYIDVKLPKTIVDAITVAQRLQIPYLWVDSLCIIQDNSADKRYQISRLRDIFRDAYLTIVAASATNAGEGFLSTRPSHGPKIRLPFLNPEGQLGTIQLRWLRWGYFASTEPWHKRAWTLEEGLLSPRSLIYGSNTLQYHCRTIVNFAGSLCDYSEESLPPLKRLLEGYLFKTDLVPGRPYVDLWGGHVPSPVVTEDESKAISLRKSWEQLIGAYTRREVTNVGDRLVFFGAVAEEFHRIWKSRYIAGLWEHTFTCDLLWSLSPADGRPLLRPVARAPTWSWASIDGPVIFRVDPEEQDFAWNFRILGWEVQLRYPVLPFGNLQDGATLIVEGILKEFIMQSPQTYEDKQYFNSYLLQPCKSSQLVSTQCNPGLLDVSFSLDADEGPYEIFTKVWVLPIARVIRRPIMMLAQPRPELRGIVMLEAGEGHYRRIGFFTGMRLEAIGQDFHLQNITII